MSIDLVDWPAVAPGTGEPVHDRDPGKPHRDGDEKGAKKSAASILVDLALDRYDFGCTADGEAFAIPRPGGHVVRMLRGGRSSLRAELAAQFRIETGRIAPQQALADALLVLEGEAQGTTPRELHLRAAEHEGAVWVDLGDIDETVIRVTPDGWEPVRSAVPVLFRRTALTGELPIPERGGDIDELWDVLNVASSDRPIVLAWLVAAIIAPNIPHPVLALFGEQGTGKSTASRTLVQLVDPSSVPLRKPPRDSDGWITAASGSWVVGLDNLSAVQDWLSDSLCRAVTGDGDVRRQLYTDAGLHVFSFRRAIILNGIDLAGLRGDLTERLAVVNLARITEHHRLSERDLNARWESAYPRMVGALLTEAARVLRRSPTVRLDSFPRMADFATILATLDELNGTSGLTRYAQQAATMAEDTLTADPFIVAMNEAVTDFTGTAADLLGHVADWNIARHGEGWRPGRDWPKSARSVTGLVRRHAPALRKAGWTVEDLGANNKHHQIIWRLAQDGARPEMSGIDTSPRSPTSPQATTREEASEARNTSGASQDDDAAAGDGPRPLPTRCRVCSQRLPASVIASGLDTHPSCDTGTEASA